MPSTQTDKKASVASNLHQQITESSRIFWRTETNVSDGDIDDDSTSSASAAANSSPSVVVVDATSSVAQELRQRNSHLTEFPVTHQRQYTLVSDLKGREARIYVDVEIDIDHEKYMKSREMTPTQERLNALTMVPSGLFCIICFFSGSWIDEELVEEARKNMTEEYKSSTATSAVDFLSFDAYSSNNSCVALPNTAGGLFPELLALPPAPVLGFLVGAVAQTYVSFIYHWVYAHALTSKQRTQHWSRRMDQSMIHVNSALVSYATSGSWSFFMINVLFNAYAVYHQFLPKVNPKRNQLRLGVAISAWTMPILFRGDMDNFLQIFVTLFVGIYFFVKYPIKGWSHSVFHVALVALMPMIKNVAVAVPMTQESIKEAAPCLALAQLMAAASS